VKNPVSTSLFSTASFVAGHTMDLVPPLYFDVLLSYQLSAILPCWGIRRVAEVCGCDSSTVLTAWLSTCGPHIPSCHHVRVQQFAIYPSNLPQHWLPSAESWSSFVNCRINLAPFYRQDFANCLSSILQQHHYNQYIFNNNNENNINSNK